MFIKTIEEMGQDAREKFIIDVREEEDFQKETYPDARNIYWGTFAEHLQEIPRDKPIYMLCYTGQRSDEIAEDIQNQGYEAYSIEGGYCSYLRIKLTRLLREEESGTEEENRVEGKHTEECMKIAIFEWKNDEKNIIYEII